MNYPLTRVDAILFVEAACRTLDFFNLYSRIPKVYFEEFDYKGLSVYSNTFDDLEIPYEFPNESELMVALQAACASRDWEQVKRLAELGVELNYGQDFTEDE
jgi:hypothetical protein